LGGRHNVFERVCKEKRANGLCQGGKSGKKESITKILREKLGKLHALVIS
jgi:hypothetical protein